MTTGSLPDLPLPPSASPHFLSRPGPIVCIGGANVDLTCRARQPIQPATSNPGVLYRTFGGVARNVAGNLARLGVSAALFTAVGRDEPGAALVAECERAGIDCRLVRRFDAATSTYVAVLDADGELVVGIAAMDVIDRLTPEVLLAHEPQLAEAGLIFADANLGAETLVALARMADRHALPLVLDPVSMRKALRVRAIIDAGLPIFLLTPNRDELAALAGEPTGTDDGLEGACGRLRARGVANLIVGLGPGGAFVSSAAGEAYVACRAASVYDVTGAGDAATAAALWALRAGHGLVAAARAGQVAAAATVAGGGPINDNLDAELLTRALSEDRDVLE